MPDCYNLLERPGIPIRRHSGAMEMIRPAQLTDRITDDPIVEIMALRPDWRFGLTEFLIGLLATCCPPLDDDAWEAGWHNPPTPEILEKAFAPYAHAFNLDGPGPRFMQDFSNLDEGEDRSPDTFVLEGPGENTLKRNADLQTKRGQVQRVARSTAATLLFVMQSYSPGGGPGFRVGVRGGGPLTTLVMVRTPDGEPLPLWFQIWAHVMPGRPAPIDKLDKIFSWLAPARTSEGDRTALSYGFRPEHTYWGTPRRVRLCFAPNSDRLPCDLTGEIDDVVVTGWRTVRRGQFYKNWPPHPLTPYYRTKPMDTPVPVHAQSTGIGYGDWVGIVVSDDKGLSLPAAAIAQFRRERAFLVGNIKPRLLAGGFDMDNAKARGFVESEMPLPIATTPDSTDLHDNYIRRFVLAADTVADMLGSAVRQALFPSGAKDDATVLPAIRMQFWTNTRLDFFQQIAGLAQHIAVSPEQPMDARATVWRSTLRRASLAIFDRAAPLDPDNYRAADGSQPIVSARKFLLMKLAGCGGDGKRLYGLLGLPLPKKGKRPEPAKHTKRKVANRRVRT